MPVEFPVQVWRVANLLLAFEVSAACGAASCLVGAALCLRQQLRLNPDSAEYAARQITSGTHNNSPT
jgi:hypothetical protein